MPDSIAGISSTGRVLFFTFILPFLSFSQDRKTDSLLGMLGKTGQDSNRVNTLNLLCVQFRGQGNYGKATEYAKEAFALSDKILFTTGKATAQNNMGSICFYLGDNAAALEYYCSALKTREEIGDIRGMAQSSTTIGIIYGSQGNYPLALGNLFKGLALYQSMENKAGISSVLNNLGIIYKMQGNYPKALEYYAENLKLAEETGNKEGRAATLGNIGNIYLLQRNYAKALEHYQKNYLLSQEIGDRQDVATSLGNIGGIYRQQSDSDFVRQGISPSERNARAYDYFSKALKTQQELGDKNGIAESFLNIGSLQIELKNYREARKYLKDALALGEEAADNDNIKETYASLSVLDSAEGNYKQSLADYKNYIIYRDSLVNEENTKKTVRAEMNFEFDKKQVEAQLEQQKKEAEHAFEKKRQKLFMYAVSVVLFLVLAFALVVYRSLLQKKKSNILLAEKNHIIEEKNKDITDSINYAKKIQEALLPDKEIKYSVFPDAFVLFQPRDIVSGDFYWFTEKNGRRLIAAADCTGHGVPGAFMSMLGNAFLNHIVNELGIVRPDLILNELRASIIKSLKQTGYQGDNQDGMDIAFLSIDDKNSCAEFAGAHNPLLLVRNGRIHETEADKQPIGYYTGALTPFTNHKIELQTGDALYIFTDGYADQFGGEKGKKFRYRQFKEKLLALQDKSMQQQEQILVNIFNAWKGSLEQTDDVLVIGVKNISY